MDAVRSLEYATYFDRHFLSRGLALHRSLALQDSAFLGGNT